MHTLLTGFGMGLSLIGAIGAQNSYLLRQAILRDRAGAVAVICIVSDLALILLGIGGIGVIVQQAPVIIDIMRWCGAAFLLGYGVLAARRALGPQQPGRGCHRTGAGGPVIITAMALTWLNPHVYLDTVLLLGTVANTHGTDGRWVFGDRGDRGQLRLVPHPGARRTAAPPDLRLAVDLADPGRRHRRDHGRPGWILDHLRDRDPALIDRWIGLALRQAQGTNTQTSPRPGRDQRTSPFDRLRERTPECPTSASDEDLPISG